MLWRCRVIATQGARNNQRGNRPARRVRVPAKPESTRRLRQAKSRPCSYKCGHHGAIPSAAMAAYSVGSVKSVASQQSWTAAISVAVAGRMCIVPHGQITYHTLLSPIIDIHRRNNYARRIYHMLTTCQSQLRQSQWSQSEWRHAGWRQCPWCQPDRCRFDRCKFNRRQLARHRLPQWHPE
jgi:hypothetical protein